MAKRQKSRQEKQTYLAGERSEQVRSVNYPQMQSGLGGIYNNIQTERDSSVEHSEQNRPQQYPETDIIQRKKGESTLGFAQRLLSICNAQIELIRTYNEEEIKDKYRQTHDIAKKVLLGGLTSENEFLFNYVIALSEELMQHERKHPTYSDRPEVKEKKRDLESHI